MLLIASCIAKLSDAVNDFLRPTITSTAFQPSSIFSLSVNGPTDVLNPLDKAPLAATLTILTHLYSDLSVALTNLIKLFSWNTLVLSVLFFSTTVVPSDVLNVSVIYPVVD